MCHETPARFLWILPGGAARRKSGRDCGIIKATCIPLSERSFHVANNPANCAAKLLRLAHPPGVQPCHHPKVHPRPGPLFCREPRPGGYTPATVNALLAGVNMYQESIHNPGGKAKPLKRQRKIFADPGRELTRAEYFRLLTAARDAGKKRTLLLLQTLCATGIRVSELRFITVEAIQRHRAGIRCKGKCREILLLAELCKRLQKWCKRRRIRSGAVFVNRRGAPLSRTTVWKLLKALCKGANVAWKKVFPHNLRHLFARTFYELDKNLSKLADVLGHSSIETTRIYIMESGAEHERLLNQMHLLL